MFYYENVNRVGQAAEVHAIRKSLDAAPLNIGLSERESFRILHNLLDRSVNRIKKICSYVRQRAH